jgi:Flp pilus assembly protein TadG
VRDRGAADALGLVLIAPAILALALLVISLGRGVDAKAQIRSAAESAAQAAALERDPSAAGEAARRAAESMLADSSTCDEPTVVTVYPPTPPAGAIVNVGVVRVTVTCRVSARGVEAIRQPYTESATAVATIDFFRARR